MYLRHLALANFRNYPRLDLPLLPGITVLWGDNGHGKSNILEAVYLLATSRSFRTSLERELVNWFADTEPVFARAAGEVVQRGGVTRLEVIIAEPAGRAPGGAASSGERPEPGPGLAPAASVRRRVRINGNDRPILDLLGHLNAVLFSPEDVELVAGPAETRRRYLDITLCQIDTHYLRALRRYVRVLAQRNALLRRQRERPVSADQFEYWDEQLTALGAELIVKRLRAIASLNQELRAIYPTLTDAAGTLLLRYRSSILPEPDALDADRAQAPEAAEAPEAVQSRVDDAQRRFREHLGTVRVRERQQGVTLAGPHRDDLSFLGDQVDLRTYGSRGQQRTATLGLKLAEVRVMERTTGERPVLLLDDMMSELDPARQALLQTAIAGHEQVILSATDLSMFRPDLLRSAHRFRVQSGSVTPAG